MDNWNIISICFAKEKLHVNMLPYFFDDSMKDKIVNKN